MRFTSRFHKGPPPTLQILYQGKLVAELTKTVTVKDAGPLYIFRYLPAFQDLKLAMLPGLPQMEQQSRKLWPFFAERIPDSRRPEIHAWMQMKNLSEDDDLRLLAELGAHSITDPFEFQFAA